MVMIRRLILIVGLVMIVVRHGKEHGEGGVGLGVEQTAGAGAHHVSLRASTTAPLHSESCGL